MIAVLSILLNSLLWSEIKTCSILHHSFLINGASIMAQIFRHNKCRFHTSVFETMSSIKNCRLRNKQSICDAEPTNFLIFRKLSDKLGGIVSLS